MRPLLLIAFLALPACMLYEGADDTPPVDDVIDFPDARPWMQPDARPDDGCEMPLPCPDAAADRYSICGRIYDVGTGGGVTNSGLTLAITFHDALAFASDPMTAAPLTPAQVAIDDCGRFIAENVPIPAANSLAVVVDDAVNAPDTHRATMVMVYAYGGVTQTQQRIYALRSSTDDAWASQVNLASSFADQGAVLGLFTGVSDNPAGGVRITADGTVQAADDYYFSTVTSRETLLPSATTTNPNGAALLLGSKLVPHSGTGGEPNGCLWSSALAAAIPGVLWVRPISFECPI